MTSRCTRTRASTKKRSSNVNDSLASDRVSRRTALALGVAGLAFVPQMFVASSAQASPPTFRLRAEDVADVVFYRNQFRERVVWQVGQTLILAEEFPIAACRLTISADSRLHELSKRLVASFDAGIRTATSTEIVSSGSLQTATFYMSDLESIAGALEVQIPLRSRITYPNDHVQDAVAPFIELELTLIDGSIVPGTVSLVSETVDEDVSPYALGLLSAWWTASSTPDLQRIYRAPASITVLNDGPASSPAASLEVRSDSRFCADPVLSGDIAFGSPAMTHEYDGIIRISRATVPSLAPDVGATYSVSWGDEVLNADSEGAFACMVLLMPLAESAGMNRVPAVELALIDRTPSQALNGLIDVARTELG